MLLSYCTYVSQAAESLGSLSPAKVDGLLLELVRALPAASTNQRASIARTNEGTAPAAAAEQEAVSIDLAQEGAASEAPVHQEVGAIDLSNEGTASAAASNQRPKSIDGAFERAASPAPASHGAGSAAPAVQDALSIHGANKGTPSAAQTNQGATSADKAAMSMAVNNTGNRNSHRGDGGDHAQWRIQADASPEPSSERSAGHLSQALTPPEGSSEISSRYDASGEPTERSLETSADGAPPEGSSARSVDRSMDLDRPRAIQGLDEGEACYLRRAASRVQTLWAKADSEGWVVEVCSRGYGLGFSSCLTFLELNPCFWENYSKFVWSNICSSERANSLGYRS